MERIRATRVAQGICSLTRLFVREQRKDEKSAPDPLSELTGRERQILELVATGRSNKEIADELFLSEKTVKHYMTNILQKLQVRNRVEAALLAQKSAVSILLTDAEEIPEQGLRRDGDLCLTLSSFCGAPKHQAELESRNVTRWPEPSSEQEVYPRRRYRIDRG